MKNKKKKKKSNIHGWPRYKKGDFVVYQKCVCGEINYPKTTLIYWCVNK